MFLSGLQLSKSTNQSVVACSHLDVKYQSLLLRNDPHNFLLRYTKRSNFSLRIKVSSFISLTQSCSIVARNRTRSDITHSLGMVRLYS